MRRPGGLVGLPSLFLALVAAPDARAAECAQSQVKPRFTQPHDGGIGGTAGSPVTLQGSVPKPASCTTPPFTHVNLEIYRKVPAAAGQTLQPGLGWGDVKLQGGQFMTTKAPVASQ